jgi:hypothetical protein
MKLVNSGKTTCRGREIFYHDPADKLRVNSQRQGDCIEWTGSKNAKGYGRTTFLGKMKLTHRVAYELVHGPISDDMRVCHRCDNPPCINPDHLFLGTQADNVSDMFKKGRGHDRRGEGHAQVKLTNAQVIEIRRCHAAGESMKSLATRYNYNMGSMWSLLKGRTWSHLLTGAQ